MTALADTPLTPRDCLLVVGLPLDEDAFRGSLRHPKTYAQGYLGQPPDEKLAWWRANNTYVPRCENVLREIELLGGKVLRRPRPQELRTAVGDHVVVAFFSHCLWDAFAPAHAIDREELTQELLFGESLACEIFRGWLLQHEEDNGIPFGGSTTDTILQALAAASRRAHDWWAHPAYDRPARSPDGVLSAAIDTFCRPEIDRQFGALVRPDAGLELGGEMRTLFHVFKESVPNDRRRIFDLRMCNSGMLVNSVKALHPGCLVVLNQWETTPLIGLIRYKAVLQDLRSRSCSYPEACARIHGANLNFPPHAKTR